MNIGSPILLIDSNAAAAQGILSELSKQFPETLLHVAHGEQAGFEALQSQPFEVVILDELAPDSGSFEFIRQLKNLDDDPVILMLSEQADPSLINAAYEAGCTRHLVKEGSWQSDLAVVVRQLLRMRRLEQENLRLLSRVLEANVMLEERNKRLDEFCASLAHDIRGPLAAVNMRLDYVLDEASSALDQRQRKTLQNANESLTRLIDMVQAMYEYARLGDKAARMEGLSLQTLMQEVVSDLPLDASLDVEVRIGDLPTAWGNPDLLRKVFLNLVSNAVKYCDKPSIKVEIFCARTTIGTLGAFHEIAVRDNGPGILEVDHHRIFQMFARGENPRGEEGGGIGLAVVQRIVELHYGRVWLESSPGSGSTFMVTVPAEPIRLA